VAHIKQLYPLLT